MKKRSDDRYTEYITDDPENMLEYLGEHSRFLKDKVSMPYPFTGDMLTLLKKSNPFKQTYYYIEDEDRFAFFIVYESRMNILTLGKREWMMKVKTVGFPCSLSNSGYITNDTAFLLSYCRRIRGAKLILNVEPSKDMDVPEKVRGMGFGETLPDCVLYLHKEHTSLEDYIGSMRSSYRRRIRIAQRRCEGIKVYYDDLKYCDQINYSPKYDIYPLYLNTYSRSEYKLECLTREFFDRCEGTGIVFVEADSDKPVGFVLLKEVYSIGSGDEKPGRKCAGNRPDRLIFMFCGMDYDCSCDNADLYFYMLLHIVEYAISRGIKTIDLGQTSELTKMKLGAVLEKRYFYAHHTNPLLNMVALLGKDLLEYKYAFPDFNVFSDVCRTV